MVEHDRVASRRRGVLQGVQKPRIIHCRDDPQPQCRPQLFYRRVFLCHDFREFRPGNRSRPTDEPGPGKDLYASILTEPTSKAWSDVRVCENAKADVERLVSLGNHLVDQWDAEGIRLARIEVADIFRAARALVPGHIGVPGGLGIALVHRTVVRETEEMAPVISRLETELGSQQRAIVVVVAAAFRFVLELAEMPGFRPGILADEEGQRLIEAGTVSTARASLIPVLSEPHELGARIGQWRSQTDPGL